jgi:hypothetical protein
LLTLSNDLTLNRLDGALLLWIQQARAKKISLTGRMIQEKAKFFAQRFRMEEFKASEGWLEKFKERHGISWRKIAGESDAADETVAANWVQEVLIPLLQYYPAEDVFNLDEFALFFKTTPDRMMDFKGQNCCDGKFSKERLSVLAGANLDGKYYFNKVYRFN